MSLFRQLIGPAFDTLPAALRRVHESTEQRTFSGRCEIRRGTAPLSRLLGLTTRMPPAGSTPVSITIAGTDREETWSRQFGAYPLQSAMQMQGGQLLESLGPTQLSYQLLVEGNRLRWQPTEVRVLRIRLPLSWFEFDIWESVEDDLYRFNVRAAVRGELLVHYRGWLR